MNLFLGIATLLSSSVFSTNLVYRGGNSSRCDVTTALASLLSPEASIILPEDASFDELLVRASSPRIEPIFSIVVEPATPEDVQHTVKFAYECDIPFLTVSSGHGFLSTLSNASGIQINMHRLQSLSLSKHGDSVHVGGGTQQKLFVETLYNWGKQSVTANCECSAIIGPLLGGGHAALQNQYGFVADGLVSATIVLFNGTALNVSSTQHADLFWALKGAGHNFGVITSFELKAYDLPKANWTMTNFFFPQDKLESFVDAANELDDSGNHDREFVLQGSILRLPRLDPINPVIKYQVINVGTPEQAEPYNQRFREVGPILETQFLDVPYKDFFLRINSSLEDNACRKDWNLFTHAISLPQYNKTAMRNGFEVYREFTADTRFNTSVWLLENYGYRGVRAVDYESAAVPAAERDLSTLTAMLAWWEGDDADTREKAEKYERMMRATLAEGQSAKVPHVYLNYASGGESLEQVYGKDKLEKLRAVKKKYDPLNKFGFYMPIV